MGILSRFGHYGLGTAPLYPGYCYRERQPRQMRAEDRVSEHAGTFEKVHGV